MKPQTTNPTSPTIGVDEAAEILHCSVEVVRKIIANGELPAPQLTQRPRLSMPRASLGDHQHRYHRQSQAKSVDAGHCPTWTPSISPQAFGPSRDVGCRLICTTCTCYGCSSAAKEGGPCPKNSHEDPTARCARL
jgi:excisionase family DNA binding protein